MRELVSRWHKLWEHVRPAYTKASGGDRQALTLCDEQKYPALASPEHATEDPTLRELIAMTVEDLVGAFVYYDRRTDAELVPGSIEHAIEAGDVTADEIIDLFAFEFRRLLTHTNKESR